MIPPLIDTSNRYVHRQTSIVLGAAPIWHAHNAQIFVPLTRLIAGCS